MRMIIGITFVQFVAWFEDQYGTKESRKERMDRINAHRSRKGMKR